MQKILKTGLSSNDIEFIKEHKDVSDGYEIQLFNHSSDLSLFNILENIGVRIHTIHIDLYKGKAKEDLLKIDRSELDKSQDLTYNAIAGNQDYLRRLFSISEKFNAFIVMHAGYRLDSFHNEEFAVKQIIRWSKEFPNLRIYLENVAQLRLYYGNKIYNLPEVPTLCNFLNNKCQHDVFYPLLDICHYYQVLSNNIESVPFSLKEAINMFNSDQFALHFNYGIGDCRGDRHSVNFETNPALLKELLIYINSINNNAKLILEICEKDYINRPDMLKHLEMIKDIEKRLIR